MAQRLLDRTEESAALTRPFGLRQPVGGAVEIFILPAIVARHALHVCAINHDTIPMSVMAGLVPAIHVLLTKKQGVYARHEAGDDGRVIMRAPTWPDRRSPRMPPARGLRGR